MLRAITSIHVGYYLLSHSCAHSSKGLQYRGPGMELAVHNRPDSSTKWLVSQIVPQPLKVRPWVYLYLVLSPNPGAGDWSEVENVFFLFLRPLSSTDCVQLAKNGMAENSGIQFGYHRFLFLISHFPIEAPYSSNMGMKCYFNHRKPFSLDTSNCHFPLFDVSYAHNFYCCKPFLNG